MIHFFKFKINLCKKKKTKPLLEQLIFPSINSIIMNMFSNIHYKLTVLRIGK